jgi:hypothetical protein
MSSILVWEIVTVPNFTITEQQKYNKIQRKIPFSILYLEALIYIAVKQVFSMVPKNHFNHAQDPVYIQFCA